MPGFEAGTPLFFAARSIQFVQRESIMRNDQLKKNGKLIDHNYYCHQSMRACVKIQQFTHRQFQTIKLERAGVPNDPEEEKQN